VNSFVSALQRFGIGRAIAVLGAAAGAAAILVALVMKAGGEPSALLYSNLDLKEASEITAALDQSNVPYEAKGDGSVIMVPRDQVASARLMLSSKGLPTSGSVGYEIFDEGNALGQTDFVQNLNQQRALEGELARTIKSLRGVSSARVHLVLPKRQLFEEEAGSPTASIVVGLSGRELGADQVRSLRNLVAGAVPNLKPDAVTVVDEGGKMLAAGAEGDSGMAGALAADRRTEAEERIRRTVKDIVEGVVGAGNARVQVTADIDQTRVTLQEEKFDPDGQVVRSTSTSEENAAERTEAQNGAVGAGVNIPEGQQENAAENLGSNSGRTEETTNYEISKTVRTEVQEPGTIKKLSVAVAVDGVTAPGANGSAGAYTPRSAQEMQRIEQLVRSAVGYDATRGDQISVINVRFDRPAAPAAAGAGSLLSNFDKNDLMRAVELLILLVVAALVIFFVVRPLIKPSAPGPQGALALASAGPGVTPAIAYNPSTGEAMVALPGAGGDDRIDIARIEGQVRASSVKQVAEFVDRHPDESVSILRTWLHDS
jgi:flagellar M-ring protein FliF